MSIIKMWLLLHPELLFWLAFVFEVEPNKCDFVALEVSSGWRVRGSLVRLVVIGSRVIVSYCLW